MSPEPEQDYFCDGIAEEIINALAQMPGLKVIARTSAFAFKGKNEDIRRIAEALGVTTVLEGSVRRAGSRIRVTVTGADKANATTPEQTPAPRLTLYREEGRASHVVLPIIPARTQSPAE